MLKWREMTKSQYLALILGSYELLIAVPGHLDPQKREANKELMKAILPAFFFEDKAGIMILAALGLFLGFQRLSYAFLSCDKGDMNDKKKSMFWPWVCLVSTHCAEVWLWYACALDQPHWVVLRQAELNARDVFVGSILRVAHGGVGLQNFVLLCGLPLITASFAFWGP